MRSRVLAAALTLTVVGRMRAGEALEAQNASELVVLEPSGDPCTRGLVLDRRRLPDGTVESFAIPQGRVLVLTRILVTAVAPAGSLVRIEVVLDNPAVPVSVPIATSLRAADAASAVDVQLGFGSGVPLASGARACVDSNASVFSTHLYGFLTRDR